MDFSSLHLKNPSTDVFQGPDAWNLLYLNYCKKGKSNEHNRTETVEKFCTSHQRQVAIGFDEDMTYETAGIICSGSLSNFCVDYNSRYTIPHDSCPSGYFKYTDSDGLGAVYGCVKKYGKGGSACPSGYTKNGNKCTKTETISCKAN